MTILQIVETAAAASLLLTVAEAVRRLYFHPIAHIPGPRLAALTWWYEFYFDVIKPGQYVFKIQELHKKYGGYPIALFRVSDIAVARRS